MLETVSNSWGSRTILSSILKILRLSCAKFGLSCAKLRLSSTKLRLSYAKLELSWS